MEVSFEEFCKLIGPNHQLGLLADYTEDELSALPRGEAGRMLLERESGKRPPVLSSNAAAAFVGCGKQTIKIKYRKLVNYTVHNGTVLYLASELENARKIFNKRGRRTVGNNVEVRVRMSSELLVDIDDFASHHGLTRIMAVNHILEERLQRKEIT